MSNYFDFGKGENVIHLLISECDCEIDVIINLLMLLIKTISFIFNVYICKEKKIQEFNEETLFG